MSDRHGDSARQAGAARAAGFGPGPAHDGGDWRAERSEPGEPGARDDPGPRRRVAGHRSRPSGRAVVGGLLVALAMLVSFAAATHHAGRPRATVVVARHRVALGSRLRAADLAVERVDLPAVLAAQAYSSTDQVVGQVTLGPLESGDLIERAAVTPSTEAPDLHLLSFAIDRDRALDGALVPGQAVDLLATYGTGQSAETAVVARQVRLVEVDEHSQSTLASTGKLVITVALSTETQALATTHASQVGTLTLVRSDLSATSPSGSGRDAEPGDGETYTFSPPSAGAGADPTGTTSATG